MSARRSLRILLVENDPDTREALETFFEAKGDYLVSAANQSKALAAAAAEKFDVIISDIGLPDGNGWELMQQLLGAADTDLIGVAMSGFGQPSDKQRSLAAGYAMHLHKPFTPDKLEAVLQQFVLS